MNVPDHFVRLVELPRTVRGVSVPNDDGTFSVYINSLCDDGTRRETLEHELVHLARDHFYKAGSVALQEAEAAGKPLTEAAPIRRIRLYPSRGELEAWLRSVGALEKPLEELGRPVW